MSIADRVTTWLDGRQAHETPRFADFARKISLDSRLARVADFLEQELKNRSEAGLPLANNTSAGH